MTPGEGHPSPGPDRRDLVVLLALAAVTAGFLAAWPHTLGNADESYFLFEAKRLRDGEVMYRDVFDFITPLAHYVMAAAYRLFGTTLATARLVMTAVHVAAVCFVYLAARALGVRRVLAVGPALALVAVGYPTFPEASPHWFATALIALLVYGLASWRWDERAVSAFALGALDGAIASMQQQKGAVLGMGLALALIVVELVSRRGEWASLVRRLAALAGGAFAVAGVVLGGTALAAGVMPMVDAVVRYPLESYAPAGTVRWGGYGTFMRPRATPGTLAYVNLLPLALVLPLVRALASVRSAPGSALVRTRLAIVLCAGASALAIAYYPDFIHIAFIAPPFLVAAADSFEWLVQRLPARGAEIAAVVLASLLVAGSVWRAGGALVDARATFAVTRETAFGPVDFARPWQASIVDRLQRELDATPGRTMFAYPQLASPYLTAGGRNPTPFQMFNGVAAPKAQVALLLETLTRERVPFVVTNPLLIDRPRDPVARYIREHYEQIDIDEIDPYADIVMWGIYERRD